MSYLKAFILANWKQAANTGLSIAALVLFIKHPEWKAYIGMGALTLAGWGLHLDPIIYDPERINARLMSKAEDAPGAGDVKH